MISLTRIAYGSRVLLHGSSRADSRYQARRRSCTPRSYAGAATVSVVRPSHRSYAGDGRDRRTAVSEAEIGIIGTTAETSPLGGGEEILVDTPYGFPSGPIAVGEVDGRRVAFLARRGDEMQVSPPRIPFRANVWAMRELGVRRILAPVVCGALSFDFDL